MKDYKTMQIYKWPYETLSQVAKETNITEFTLNLPDDDIEKFENDVILAMLSNNGIGLAANQLGYLNRFFAIGHRYFKHFKKPVVVWNPKIINQSKEEMLDEEGCLSFPQILVKVKRPRLVEVEYETSDTAKYTTILDGIESKCFQHELDHLNGITFNKRVSKARWQMKKKIRPRKPQKDHRFI